MMHLSQSTYHSLLRICAATLACTLVFVSGLVWPATEQLTLQTEQYVATVVGATAAVEPTPLNTVTAALTQQQTELDARAAALAERELALGLSSAETTTNRAEYTTLLNSVLLFIVLLLMVINYVLDFRYRRREHVAARVHNAV